jgi:protein PsiE|tara:strand:- start:540 stop:995 length:456 start_codon:yes stop_codon:yes gene_type:complete
MASNNKNDENENSDRNANDINQTEGPCVGKTEKSFVLGVFHLIERIILFIVVLMTMGAVVFEIHAIYIAQTLSLADILLMFLYLEVIGMVAVFYSDRRSAFVYPIFIAITALARLIVLQGKDMAPENILYEAFAIFILAIAAIILLRMRIE